MMAKYGEWKPVIDIEGVKQARRQRAVYGREPTAADPKISDAYMVTRRTPNTRYGVEDGSNLPATPESVVQAQSGSGDPLGLQVGKPLREQPIVVPDRLDNERQRITQGAANAMAAGPELTVDAGGMMAIGNQGSLTPSPAQEFEQQRIDADMRLQRPPVAPPSIGGQGALPAQGFQSSGNVVADAVRLGKAAFADPDTRAGLMQDPSYGVPGKVMTDAELDAAIKAEAAGNAGAPAETAGRTIAPLTVGDVAANALGLTGVAGLSLFGQAPRPPTVTGVGGTAAEARTAAQSAYNVASRKPGMLGKALRTLGPRATGVGMMLYPRELGSGELSPQQRQEPSMVYDEGAGAFVERGQPSSVVVPKPTPAQSDTGLLDRAQSPETPNTRLPTEQAPIASRTDPTPRPIDPRQAATTGGAAPVAEPGTLPDKGLGSARSPMFDEFGNPNPYIGEGATRPIITPPASGAALSASWENSPEGTAQYQRQIEAAGGRILPGGSVEVSADVPVTPGQLARQIRRGGGREAMGGMPIEQLNNPEYIAGLRAAAQAAEPTEEEAEAAMERNIAATQAEQGMRVLNRFEEVRKQDEPTGFLSGAIPDSRASIVDRAEANVGAATQGVGSGGRRIAIIGGSPRVGRAQPQGLDLSDQISLANLQRGMNNDQWKALQDAFGNRMEGSKLELAMRKEDRERLEAQRAEERRRVEQFNKAATPFVQSLEEQFPFMVGQGQQFFSALSRNPNVRPEAVPGLLAQGIEQMRGLDEGEFSYSNQPFTDAEVVELLEGGNPHGMPKKLREEARARAGQYLQQRILGSL
jgi:hypothetical protein